MDNLVNKHFGEVRPGACCKACSHRSVLQDAHNAPYPRCSDLCQACKPPQRGPAGPICGSPARARALPSRLWFWRSTAPGAGYGRCWNRGPVAVVSAARGCAPSKPTDQPPLGASEYAVCAQQPYTSHSGHLVIGAAEAHGEPSPSDKSSSGSGHSPAAGCALAG